MLDIITLCNFNIQGLQYDFNYVQLLKVKSIIKNTFILYYFRSYKIYLVNREMVAENVAVNKNLRILVQFESEYK